MAERRVARDSTELAATSIRTWKSAKLRSGGRKGEQLRIGFPKNSTVGRREAGAEMSRQNPALANGKAADAAQSHRPCSVAKSPAWMAG
jgi:hypothetical protein